MNKNLYLLYKISKQIKDQYLLYNKYGFSTKITSLSNKLTKQQSFIISKKVNQNLFQTDSLMDLSKNNTRNNLTLKHNSFLSSNAGQIGSFNTHSGTSNYIVHKDKVVDFSNSIDTEFGINHYESYKETTSFDFFKLENTVEEKSNVKSFRIPKDFTTDFRNIEDWTSIQNKPYDALLRENLSELNEGDSTKFLPPENVTNELENQDFSWTKDSDLFYNSYIKVLSNKPESQNLISLAQNESVALKVWQELEELVHDDSFSQKYKNDVLVEQIITDDLQGIYKNRLSTEKKLRWFYGLLTKSSFNRLIHPFKTNRSLSSKKSLGSSVLNQLESRLDIQLFRMGWVPTITAARQLIKHNHILVWSKNSYSGSFNKDANKNPEKKFPSYSLQTGDLILLRPKSFSILQTYWDISCLPITENKTKKISSLFSYKFPWYLFDKSSILNSTGSRWDSNRQDVSEKETTPFFLTAKNGNIKVNSSLGDQLINFIDFNKDKDLSNKLQSSFTTTESLLHNNELNSHLEYNPKLMFHLYRKAPNLSALRFPQLDPIQLKSFLFSHN